METALRTQGLRKTFGGLAAVDGVSLECRVGRVHAVIGPNGAGKTTLINLLTGVLRPHAGSVRLEGHDITRLAPQRRVALGLARTFQINQLFADMTPLETVGLAVSEHLGHGADWWRLAGGRQAIDARIAGILERFHLADVMLSRTSQLPYGKQRLLEIALAIACSPRVLLLDEPAAGVPEEERHEILAAVSALPREVSVLFIEHDMHIVFRFASHIIVLVGGAVFTQGTPKEISSDPGVREVYLGTRKHG